MRIFFIGCVEFSQATLNKVISCGGNVVGVATKSKSIFNSDHVDLSEQCKREGIPYKYVKDINAPHIVEWISSLSPDIIFVFGWSSLIKKDLLNLTPIGVLGFHPAKLPSNRGRHPIIWSLVLGLEETASTFFFMDEGADSGDILSQQDIKIEKTDTARILYEKVKEAALKQIEEFLPTLKNKDYRLNKQGSQSVNYWRKRGRIDGQIDFRMSSIAIYNLVRALTKPYVGAHIYFNNEDIKIWAVEILECDSKNLEPGKVLELRDNGIRVKTYDGSILITKHDFNELPQINTYL